MKMHKRWRSEAEALKFGGKKCGQGIEQRAIETGEKGKYS